MDFSSLVGQTGIISRLERAIANNNIGHAYVFSGPRGSGKKTAARIFASMLLCNTPGMSGSCGKCRSCYLLSNSSHPDFIEVLPGESSIGVGQIREIQAGVSIRPMYSSRKVYIIADAEKMTDEAQNCLLKTLEEPPEYIVIILTSSNYDALLGTIRSRAVKYSFSRNSPGEVKSLLTSRFGHLGNADFIAACSGGVVGRALELAGSQEFNQIREKTFDILGKLAEPRLMEAFELFPFYESNKAFIEDIFDIMIMYYRDMLVMKKAPGQILLINSDKKDNILDDIPVYSDRRLLDNINIIESTRNALRQNANYQLAIEVMLMKLQED